MPLLSHGYLAFRGVANAAKVNASGLQQTLAKALVNAAGYRKLGLRADDLIPEENAVVQLALRRISPQESYDRNFRLRRAFQCSMSQQLLPAHEQTTQDTDLAYLSPYIAEIEAEIEERENLDAVIVERTNKIHE